MIASISKLPLIKVQSLAWKFLLEARSIQKQWDNRACYLFFDETGHQVSRRFSYDASSCLWIDENGCWSYADNLPPAWQSIFDLYLPVLGNAKVGVRVIAHLGQSIDGCIATLEGDSFYVTGEENRKHLHCLRALSDAVVVGAGTALADDPQLTTRAVAGDNPVRVIIDPAASLPDTLGICNDAQAKTILLHRADADLSAKQLSFGPVLADTTDTTGSTGATSLQVERWLLPDVADSTAPQSIVRFLADRGLRRLFVEGGGITVSRFFEDKAINRLHLGVAPLLVGKGRPALQLKGVDSMLAAHRPPCAVFRMGDDVLWDFDIENMHDVDRVVKNSDADTAGAIHRIV